MTPLRPLAPWPRACRMRRGVRTHSDCSSAVKSAGLPGRTRRWAPATVGYMSYPQRRAALREHLRKRELNALLVTDLLNIRYLSGFTGSNGANLGADDFITKPFEGSDLLNAVENSIKKKSLNNQVSAREIRNYAPPIDGHSYAAEPLQGGQDPLRALISNCETIRYSKKHVIYKESSMPRFLYYIKSGKVKTYKSHPDGKDLVVGLFGEGDYMGYAVLLEGTRHIETAEVIEDCEVVMIPRKKIEDLMTSNSQVTRKFMQLLIENLLEKERQALGLAYNTLRKKVAEALMSFEKKFHTSRDEKFSINIGRDELATIAGTATESLIRTLTEFKQENLIEIDHGIITIVNQSRLQHLVR